MSKWRAVVTILLTMISGCQPGAPGHNQGHEKKDAAIINN